MAKIQLRSLPLLPASGRAKPSAAAVVPNYHNSSAPVRIARGPRVVVF